MKLLFKTQQTGALIAEMANDNFLRYLNVYIKVLIDKWCLPKDKLILHLRVVIVAYRFCLGVILHEISPRPCYPSVILPFSRSRLSRNF